MKSVLFWISVVLQKQQWDCEIALVTTDTDRVMPKSADSEAGRPTVLPFSASGMALLATSQTAVVQAGEKQMSAVRLSLGGRQWQGSD